MQLRKVEKLRITTPDAGSRLCAMVNERGDQGNLRRQYAGRGSKAHRPATLLAILVYVYSTGVFSSKLEIATYDSVAFRYIAAGSHPDHDILATFCRRFVDELTGLFLQVLEMAKEMKLRKMGTVCLDGTKIHANASRHSALSPWHIGKIDEQLKQEVQAPLALAEQADTANIPDGMCRADGRTLHVRKTSKAEPELARLYRRQVLMRHRAALKNSSFEFKITSKLHS